MPFDIAGLKLTRGALAALPIIQSLIETAATANEILDSVKEAGIGLRRQVGLDVIGQLRENVDLSRYLRLLPGNAIPDITKLGKSVTNINKAISYSVKGSGVNPETGEREPIYVTVTSNEPLTKNQVLARATGYVQGGTKLGSDRSDYGGITMDVTGGVTNSFS